MDDETTAAAAKDPDPFFDVHIFVCCNRRPEGHARGSCAARGSESLRDYMKARVKEARIPHARVNTAGCLDRCEDGPCMVIYPAGVWYRIETRSDVDAVIEQHLKRGGRAEALRLPVGRSVEWCNAVVRRPSGSMLEPSNAGEACSRKTVAFFRSRELAGCSQNNPHIVTYGRQDNDPLQGGVANG